MVRRHKVHGLRPQQAHAVQLAPVQHELHEAAIVLRSRRQTATAGLKQGGPLDVKDLHKGLAIGVAFKWLRHAVVVIGGHGKGGIGHLQRPKNMLLEKFTQTQPAGHFDHPAQHVGGTAVFPHRAGVGNQWQLPQGGHEVGIGTVACAHAGRGVLSVDGACAQKFVADAGRVAQQVVHGSLPCGWAQRILVALGTDHLRFGKFRNETAHRAGQQQLALLHQHHDRYRRDRLGHRINAEHRIRGHGHFFLGLLPSQGLVHHDFALAGNVNHAPRQALAVNFVLQDGAKAFQAVREEVLGHGGMLAGCTGTCSDAAKGRTRYNPGTCCDALYSVCCWCCCRSKRLGRQLPFIARTMGKTKLCSTLDTTVADTIAGTMTAMRRGMMP